TRLNHRVNQVHLLITYLTCFHPSARDEDGRYDQPHGSHQHPRCDLVAVSDAYLRIRLVGIDHILYRVGDQIARWQGVQHAVMSHGDTIIYGDGVELGSETAQLLNLLLHHLPDLVQMHMSRHKLSEGVDNRDDGLTHLLSRHAVGMPERPRTCHTTPLRACSAAQYTLVCR